MKVAIVYPHVITPNSDYSPEIEQQSGTYEDSARRFVDTYKQFPGGIDSQLFVVFTNGLPPDRNLYDGLDCEFFFYKGTRWCTGVHQWALDVAYGYHLQDSFDFIIFSSARTYFWKEGWLKRMAEARERHGEGMYATMSSNENMPHLRTNFYSIPGRVLRSYVPVLSRGDTWKFESGDWNISRYFQETGQASMLVTWDGEYAFPDWRKPANIFRRGDQSNCLVWDRHTEIFANSTDEERERLRALSDGEKL